MAVKSQVRGVLSALALFSGVIPFYAPSGTLSFTGAVTNITCNVYVEVDGSVGNVVNLGSVSPDRAPVESDVVRFALKPDLKHSGCSGLTGKDTVTITWSGNFTASLIIGGLEGMLGAQTGEATDAGVMIVHDRSPEPDSYIIAKMPGSSVSGDDFLKQGARYKALLLPGTKRGTFQTAAAYVVVYD